LLVWAILLRWVWLRRPVVLLVLLLLLVLTLLSLSRSGSRSRLRRASSGMIATRPAAYIAVRVLSVVVCIIVGRI
jgi:hypothetical protein